MLVQMANSPTLFTSCPLLSTLGTGDLFRQSKMLQQVAYCYFPLHYLQNAGKLDRTGVPSYSLLTLQTCTIAHVSSVFY